MHQSRRSRNGVPGSTRTAAMGEAGSVTWGGQRSAGAGTCQLSLRKPLQMGTLIVQLACRRENVHLEFKPRVIGEAWPTG